MLNNQNLSLEEREVLRDLSYSSATLSPEKRHLPYQTKVGIFDEKCGGCPFALLKVTEVLNRATGHLYNVYPFDNHKDFTDFINKFSFAKNLIVERGCTWGIESIKDAQAREQYWTVQEIIQNTCDLWKITKGEWTVEGVVESVLKSTDYDKFQHWYYSGALVFPKEVRSKVIAEWAASDLIMQSQLESLS